MQVATMYPLNEWKKAINVLIYHKQIIGLQEQWFENRFDGSLLIAVLLYI